MAGALGSQIRGSGSEPCPEALHCVLGQKKKLISEWAGPFHQNPRKFSSAMS